MKEMELLERDSVFNLINELSCLQDERVYTYDLFNEGHKIYLTSGPSYEFSKFHSLVLDITQELKRISVGVARIEAKLRPSYADLANLIVSLEEDEKRKLRIIAKLQMAKQNLKDHPKDIKGLDVVADLKRQLGANDTKISELFHYIRCYQSDFD